MALQENYDCIYCVVDMHAITVWQDPADLRRSTREVTAAFIAAGVDPKKHIIFNQSQVERACGTRVDFELRGAHRLAEPHDAIQGEGGQGPRERQRRALCLSRFSMAADILAYRATHVPVGDDQKQHLELARDIAQKFNVDFAETIAAEGFADGFFPQPEPIIAGPATRVMSLRDGTKKMSKSDPSDLSRINVADDADTIAKKIRKAKTDPEPLPTDEKGFEGRPEAENLVGIYAALSGQSMEAVLREFGGAQFSQFKNALADLAVEKLGPIGAEMKRISADNAYIDGVLAEGAERAHAIADETLRHVRNIVGFVQAEPRRKSMLRLPPTDSSATGSLCRTARLAISSREGHKRKFLVIVDESPEGETALFYAARRANGRAAAWRFCS